MTPSDAAESRTYHYAQMRKNQDTVRRQGTLINQSLKRMHKMSSAAKEDDVTQQYITLPPEVDPVTRPLEEALESCASTLAETVPAVERPFARDKEPTKPPKRWYRWKD